MNVLDSLRPTSVWSFFYEICQVPRPSKHEQQIINFLLEFGKKYKLETKIDKAGNVLISKPATKNFEKNNPVLLQSHVDMVCEKNNISVHDFFKDPIIPRIDDEWVTATGTTLGADDGIGMASQLAILASDNIEHGPIECLFTVDEETGLTGAKELESGFFKSKKLINLDSEDEGEVCIGCAGGIDSTAIFDLKYEPVFKKAFACIIKVSGLSGGHSGEDINKGRANANKILTRFLTSFSELFDFHLALIDGGNLRNAIPREAYAVCVIPGSLKEPLRVEFNILSHDIEQEFLETEPNMLLTLQSVDVPEMIISADLQKKILMALDQCQNGVVAMSDMLPDLVQTSTNLASIKIKNDKLEIVSSHRSSVYDEKITIANNFRTIFEKHGASVTISDGYPGWEPKIESPILKQGVRIYSRLFGKKPKIRIIHAGLECGLFLEKYPDLDMISIGPTIKEVHSPNERINIESVQKFWQFLLEMIKE